MVVMCAALIAQTSGIDLKVESRTGVAISAFAVPLVKGSWFQYYEPDWSAGFYSSQFQNQSITKQGNVTVLTFVGKDPRAYGTQRFEQVGNQILQTNTYGWKGTKPVNVEATAGMFWVPPFANGAVRVDDQSTQISPTAPTSPEMEGRPIGKPGTKFEFDTQLGKVQVQSDLTLDLFDARGYGQDWARTAPLLWLGAGAITIPPNSERTWKLTWTLPSRPPSLQKLPPAKVVAPATGKSVLANDDVPVLIPKPKKSQLNFEKTTPLGGKITLPGGRFTGFDHLLGALDRYYSDWKTLPDTIAIDGGLGRLGLPPGGYRISIKPGSASIIGEDPEGLRTGIERLARLAFRRDGKLVLPTGIMVDAPERDFRGVHLFVGPEATAFQSKLWTRVLRPLGFNQVVLQCERTGWDAIPGTQTSETMKKEDLAKLFAAYRAMHVEPTPMIQSFGHMEWLFANQKNLDLAFNREVPYAIDPRKPEAQAKMAEIWAEAIALLNPKNLHFGLDEVDMRGFPDDPKLVTALWQQQIPFLADIAKKNGKKMMLWGDKGLAPGEAIDAAHGHDATEAAARRTAIPKDALITDWHYRAEPESEPFRKSLNVWAKSGQRPIASMWFRPENIRGFTLAAKGYGTLQTTWAGYTSNEANMMREFRQFSAMILAADYAWSDRGEMPNAIGYDPTAVFRDLYFGAPKPVKPQYRVGQTLTAPAKAGSILDGVEPSPIVLAVGTATGAKAKISAIYMKLETAFEVSEGEIVANAEVQFADGTKKSFPIRYGWHVRAAGDARPTMVSPASGFQIPTQGKAIRQVVLTPTSRYSGLNLNAYEIESASLP